MPFTLDFWRALADYRLRFPDANSLGAAVATWLTEMARVRKTAFAAVLLTNSSSEGSSAGGQKHFESGILADALHCRRFEIDDDYELPPHLAGFASAKAKIAMRQGRNTTVRFSP
jgi:hypothetical protein